LETFNELNRRFPDNENKEQTAHYLRIMSDADYRQRLTMSDKLQDELYQTTYQAYLNGQTEQIRANTQQATELNPQSELMPKFLFLDAMTYAQQRDTEGFKTSLKELITQYPNADVSELASEMMKRFQRGLVLSASGNNMLANGNLFNIQWGDSAAIAENIDSIPFSPEMQTPWELLILYPQGKIDDNMLLYTVASFNFGNFIQSDFDLDKNTVGTFGMLQIQPFDRYDAIMQYLEMIYGEEGYANDLDSSVVVIPISQENYSILMKGKSLDDYWKFFEENFSVGNEDLIERWKVAQKVQEDDFEIQNATLTPKKQPIEDVEQITDDDVKTELPENPLLPENLNNDSTIVETNTLDNVTGKADDLLNKGSEKAEQVKNKVNNSGIVKFLKRLFGGQ
jgi:hypothetical protein